MASKYLRLFLSKILDDLGFPQEIQSEILGYEEFQQCQLCSAVTLDLERVQGMHADWIYVHPACWQVSNQWAFVDELKNSERLAWALVKESFQARAWLSLNVIQAIETHDPQFLSVWWKIRFKSLPRAKFCFAYMYEILQKANLPDLQSEIKPLVDLQLRYHMLSNNGKFIFNAFNQPYRINIPGTTSFWLTKIGEQLE